MIVKSAFFLIALSEDLGLVFQRQIRGYSLKMALTPWCKRFCVLNFGFPDIFKSMQIKQRRWGLLELAMERYLASLHPWESKTNIYIKSRSNVCKISKLLLSEIKETPTNLLNATFCYVFFFFFWFCFVLNNASYWDQSQLFQQNVDSLFWTNIIRVIFNVLAAMLKLICIW